MTLEDLITQFREDTGDTTRPYKFSDDYLAMLLSEAEEEAALRKRLLPETWTIDVTAAESTYPLEDNVLSIDKAMFLADGEADTDTVELILTTRKTQDRQSPGWRFRSEPPTALIVDDTQVVFACLPDAAGTLTLEGCRAPSQAMTTGSDTPEIGRAHHRFLTKWAEHRAYMRPDSETLDPARSERAEKAFTAHFGNRPDADMRRDEMADGPSRNVAVW